MAKRPISTHVAKPCWLRHWSSSRNESVALRLVEPTAEDFTSFLQLEKAGEL